MRAIQERVQDLESAWAEYLGVYHHTYGADEEPSAKRAFFAGALCGLDMGCGEGKSEAPGAQEVLELAIRACKQNAGRQEQFSRRALRSPFAVVRTDQRGRLTWMNTEFSRLCGYGMDELAGKKPGHVLQGPDSDRSVIRAMGQAVKERKNFRGRIVNYAKDGRRYEVQIAFEPIEEGFVAVEAEPPVQTDGLVSELRELVATTE